MGRCSSSLGSDAFRFFPEESMRVHTYGFILVILIGRSGRVDSTPITAVIHFISSTKAVTVILVEASAISYGTCNNLTGGCSEGLGAF